MSQGFTKEHAAILRKRLLLGTSANKIAEEEGVSSDKIARLVNVSATKPQDITFTEEDLDIGSSMYDYKEIRLSDGKIGTTTKISGGKGEIPYKYWGNRLDAGKNNEVWILGSTGTTKLKFKTKAAYDLCMNYLLNWIDYKNR